jgi:hypothetical protein
MHPVRAAGTLVQTDWENSEIRRNDEMHLVHQDKLNINNSSEVEVMPSSPVIHLLLLYPLFT